LRSADARPLPDGQEAEYPKGRDAYEKADCLPGDPVEVEKARVSRLKRLLSISAATRFPMHSGRVCGV
jgi:hypothetical protein